jgi:hypothetical protein
MTVALITLCIVLCALCVVLAIALVFGHVARKQETAWLTNELHSLRENYAKDAVEYEQRIMDQGALIKSLRLQLQELGQNRDFRDTILGPTG